MRRSHFSAMIFIILTKTVLIGVDDFIFVFVLIFIFVFSISKQFIMMRACDIKGNSIEPSGRHKW